MSYGLFFLKVLTIVIAVAVVVMLIASAGMRGRKGGQNAGHIEISKLNEQLESMEEALSLSMLDPEFQKQELKERKAAEKAERKASKKAAKLAAKQRGNGETRVTEPPRKRLFVLDFDGDIRAATVERLRKEITAVLTSAQADDEVVVRLESGGGMVTGYGLGASQLDRLVQKRIPVTVCVDKVAASGGYMMACVGNKILAAPFAVLGSIGVVAQIPNVHRLLKKNDIDVELLTAGKFKRTLTVLGENTEEGREKFKEDIERIHDQFKAHVSHHRPVLDIETVATGEVWSGDDALEHKLVDALMTSDEYLMTACDAADVLQVTYKEKKPIMERLALGAEGSIDRITLRWVERLWRSRFDLM